MIGLGESSVTSHRVALHEMAPSKHLSRTGSARIAEALLEAWGNRVSKTKFVYRISHPIEPLSAFWHHYLLDATFPSTSSHV